MIEVLKLLLSGGLIWGICYIANIIGKCVVSNMIATNNNMTDAKAKYLTQMMSKDIFINLPKSNSLL